MAGLEFLGGVDLFIELEAEFTRASVFSGREVSFELGVGHDAFDAFGEEAFLEEVGIFFVGGEEAEEVSGIGGDGLDERITEREAIADDD